MTRLQAAIWVDADPHTVFLAVESGLHSETGKLSLRPLTPVRGPGAMYCLSFRYLGLPVRLDVAVTEHEYGKKLTWKGPPRKHTEAETTLIPEGGGTRLVIRARYRLPVLCRWLPAGEQVRAEVWSLLQQVKSRAEVGLAEAAVPS